MPVIVLSIAAAANANRPPGFWFTETVEGVLWWFCRIFVWGPIELLEGSSGGVVCDCGLDGVVVSWAVVFRGDGAVVGNGSGGDVVVLEVWGVWEVWETVAI